MYNIKMILCYADAILVMILRDLLPATGAYENVKSSTSIINNPHALVLEYILQSLSISVVFTLKQIMGRNIFVSDNNKERLYEATKVVNFSILS